MKRKISYLFTVLAMLGSISCKDSCDQEKNKLLFTKAKSKIEIEKEYTEAVSILRGILECDNSDSVNYFLGSAYLLQFNKTTTDSAVYFFKRTIELNPDHELALYSLGTIYIRSDSTCKEGLDLLLRGYKINPNLYYIENAIANAYECLRMPEEELIYRDKLLQKEPENPHLLKTLGTSYLKLERYREAIIEYDKVLAINPTDGEALHKRGIAKLYLTDTLTACGDFSKAASLGYEKAIQSIEKYCNKKRGLAL